jgi:hypothetical protein
MLNRARPHVNEAAGYEARRCLLRLSALRDTNWQSRLKCKSKVAIKLGEASCKAIHRDSRKGLKDFLGQRQRHE